MISAWWLLPPVLLWAGHAAWQRRRLGRLEEELWRLRSALSDLEERLRRRSDRLDALFANVNEAILRLDVQGNVVALNERARRVFHFPADLTLPQPITALYRQPRWNAAVKEALRRLPEAAELPDIHLPGCVLAVRLAPLENGQALLLCLDISRQRQLEAQRERLVRDLMHDLKTPLTSILGYARTIERMGEDESVRLECTAVIVREARRLNKLLASMLELDRIERFSPVREGGCDPVEVVRDLRQRMQPVAEAAGVSLRVKIGKAIGRLAMDGGDLLRVLTNLVDNAIRYSPKDGRVDIHVRKTAAGIELQVTDEGPGIAPKHLPHVTERFYRGDDSRATGEGHGVGLAIASETVGRHGGSLKLENRPQGGLSARILLPTETP